MEGNAERRQVLSGDGNRTLGLQGNETELGFRDYKRGMTPSFISIVRPKRRDDIACIVPTVLTSKICHLKISYLYKLYHCNPVPDAQNRRAL